MKILHQEAKPMKNHKSFFFLVTIIFFLTFSTNCMAESSDYCVVYGRITDSDFGFSIQGARVIMGPELNPDLGKRTNSSADGSYQIYMEHTTPSYHRKIQCSIVKDGYFRFSESFVVDAGETRELNVQLLSTNGYQKDAQPTITIKGHVYDSSSKKPMCDATISAYAVTEPYAIFYNTNTKTDSNGYYELHVIPGFYTVQAYNPESKNFYGWWNEEIAMKASAGQTIVQDFEMVWGRPETLGAAEKTPPPSPYSDGLIPGFEALPILAIFAGTIGITRKIRK
jgi:hypothetical protein